jgi:DNA-binding HxlR family transcriptional regulator
MTKSVATVLCPRYHRAVELIGRRWTGALLRMLLSGPTRFGDLRSAVPEISDRMLSERLKELEAEGIVVREVSDDTPVRVVYRLTDKGRALEAPLRAIGAWAEEWIVLS